MKRWISYIVAILVLAFTFYTPALAAGGDSQTFFADANLEVYDQSKSAVMLSYYVSPDFSGYIFYAEDGAVVGAFTGPVNMSNLLTVLDQFNDYRGVSRAPNI